MGQETTKEFLKDYKEILSFYNMEENSFEFITSKKNIYYLFLFFKDLFKQFKSSFPDGEMTMLEFIEMHKNFKSLSKNEKSVSERESFFKSMFEKMDLDKNGKINFKEYVIWLLLSKNKKTDQTLKLVFEILDKDSSGFLDQSEMMFFVNFLCTDFANSFEKIFGIKNVIEKDKTKSFVKELFDTFDINKDKKISNDEFTKVCLSSKELQSLFVSSFDELTTFTNSKISIPVHSGDSFIKEEKVFKRFNDSEFSIYEFLYKINNINMMEHERNIFSKYYGRTAFECGKGKMESFLQLENFEFNKKKSSLMKIYCDGKSKNSIKVWREEKYFYFQNKNSILEPEFLLNFIFKGGAIWKTEMLVDRVIPILKIIKTLIKNKLNDKIDFNNACILVSYDSLDSQKNEKVDVKLVDFENCVLLEGNKDAGVESKLLNNSLSTKNSPNSLLFAQIDAFINCISKVKSQLEIII